MTISIVTKETADSKAMIKNFNPSPSKLPNNRAPKDKKILRTANIMLKTQTTCSNLTNTAVMTTPLNYSLPVNLSATISVTPQKELI
uniref:hypothetical protein n=1 Tax=Psychrobacter sp. TaxID=56811 RepID=UPI0015EEE3D4|nr:hypothetical protein [Psychrobacter sp.]